MDVQGFIDDCRTQWPSFEQPRALSRVLHPSDRRLAGLAEEVEGSATENKLMLLNLAARHLSPGEIYVEIGSWCGLTLAGAASGNPGASIVACDNFSRPWSSPETLWHTIGRFSAPGQVRFFDLDFREFLSRAPWRPSAVGVYFYDAGHSFAEQFDALELMRPWLADDALVIVDDTNDIAVRAAHRLFLRHRPGFTMIADVRTRADCQATWWNGVQMFRFARARDALLPIPSAVRWAHEMVGSSPVTLAQRALTLPFWWSRRRWRFGRELVLPRSAVKPVERAAVGE
jgi:hypothetical protein